MEREGEEVHVEVDEARGASTPNIVRWVLAISLLAVIVLLSAVWMFGAATTDKADRAANVTDRMTIQDSDDTTDGIVSDRPGLIEGGTTTTAPDETTPAMDASPTPE